MDNTEDKPGKDGQPGPNDDRPGYNDPATEPERPSSDIEGDPERGSDTDVEDPDPTEPDGRSPDGDDEIGYYAERRPR